MKWWPIILLCAAIMFFFASYTPRPQEKLNMLDDGCLIYALHYKNSVLAQEMLGKTIWARVLAIHFEGGFGHAVTVFVYENNTFVYDPNRGSFIVSPYPIYDPLTIAEIAFSKIVIKRAYYLEPTFLLHYRNEKKKDPFKIKL
jgi:hypothetical protein